MAKKIELIILVVIIGLGFFLRFWRLDRVPAGLNWDEAAIAYNAYSLLETGKDEFGRSWPLFIESFGNYPTGLYSILSVPILKYLGLSVFSARLLNVIVGTSTILIAYYLGQAWFGQRRLGLVLAGLIAFSPLTIHLSRFALEWYAALPLFLLGMTLLMAERNWFQKLPWAAVIFAFSLYWYHSLRLFLPLLLLAYVLIYRDKITQYKKTVFLSILIGLIAIVPLLVSLVHNQVMARPAAVSIFAGEAQQYQQKEEVYRATFMNWPLGKVVANKVVFFAEEIIYRYLGHFTPNFLFFGQDATGRISTYPLGKLPLLSIPFLLIGLGVLLRRHQKSDLLLIAWILLAPLPASFSQDAPHGLRSLFLLPALQIVVIIGLIEVYQLCKQQFAPKFVSAGLLALGLLFSLELNRQMFYYFNFYPEETAKFWQADQVKLVKKINHYYDKYEQIILSPNDGQPHIFLAFFTPIAPATYQQQVNEARQVFNSRLDHLGKIRFSNPSSADYCQDNTLIIIKERLDVPNLEPIDDVRIDNRFHEEKPSFYFYDTKQELIKSKVCVPKN